jgi:hypothetical protein
VCRFRSSGFPARVLSFGDTGGAVCLTRSREAAKKVAMGLSGVRWGERGPGESAGVSAVGVWQAAFLPYRRRCIEVLCPPLPRCCVPVTAPSMWCVPYRLCCSADAELSSRAATVRERLCVPVEALGAVWPNAKSRGSVFGVRSGEPRTGVRWCAVSVARAFQPEICPLRLECPGSCGVVAVLFVSREAAKPQRETQWGCCACVELPALLSTFSNLLSMAWMP